MDARGTVGHVLRVPGVRVFANPRLRLLAALLLLGGALYITWLGLDGFRSMQDFRNEFVPVARMAWAGRSPFAPLQFGAPGRFMAGGATAIYTPPFLWMMWPWTVLPLPLGEVAWFALEWASAAGILVLVYRRIGNPGAAELAVVVSAMLLLMPFRDSLNDGQVSLPLGFLLAAVMSAHQGGRRVLGGVALGVATAVKVTPLGALAYFAWRRDWHLVAATLAAAALVAAASLASGWGGYWPGFLHNISLTSAGTASALNQSLNGMVLRWFNPGQTGQPIPPLGAVTRLTWLVLQGLLAAALVVRVGSRPPRDRLEEWAVYCCLLLALPLLSPFAWAHHYALALAALPVGVRLALLRRLSPLAVLAGVVALVAVIALEVPLTLAALADGAGLQGHPVRALGGSVLVLGALAWFTVLAAARSRPGPGGDPRGMTA